MKAGILLPERKEKASKKYQKLIIILTISFGIYLILPNIFRTQKNNVPRLPFNINEIPLNENFQNPKNLKSEAKNLIFNSFYTTKLFGSCEESSSKFDLVVEKMIEIVEKNEKYLEKEDKYYFNSILRIMNRYKEIKILRKFDDSVKDFPLRILKILGISDWKLLTTEGDLEKNGNIGKNEIQLKFWENIKEKIQNNSIKDIINSIKISKENLIKYDQRIWFLNELEIQKLENLESLSSEDHLFLRIVEQILSKIEIKNQEEYNEKKHLSEGKKVHDYFFYITNHPLDMMNRVTNTAKKLAEAEMDFLFGPKGYNLCRGLKNQEEYDRCWQSKYKETFPEKKPEEKKPGFESHNQALAKTDYGSFSSGGVKYYFIDTWKNEVYFNEGNKRFYALKDSVEETGYFNLRGQRYSYVDRSRKYSYFKVNGRLYIIPQELAKDYGYEYRNGIKHYYLDTWKKEVVFSYRDEIYFADGEFVKRDSYYSYNGLKCWYLESSRNSCIYELGNRAYLAKVDTLRKAN